jgi:hypothetical protein
VSGYVGVKNKIFGVLLICMNCLWKAEKQHLIKSMLRVGRIFSDKSRCSQCCLKRRTTVLTQLSSMEGVASMTAEKSPSD